MKKLQIVLNFLCYLESFKSKFKNLHWSAANLTYHRAIDELLDDLNEFQDEVAETFQGFLGEQFQPNFLVGRPSIKSICPMETICLLIEAVDGFCETFKDDYKLNGILNSINDFQQELLKHRYLFMLAEKDGGKIYTPAKAGSRTLGDLLTSL